MERFNIVLPLEDSEWLDRFALEIREQNGAKVSRSEIVRAAIAGLRELHLRAPERPSRFDARTPVPTWYCSRSLRRV